MALVVLLRGINVGGHRLFRPTQLAESLRRFDVVNIGAAGTLVVRNPVSQAELRAALVRRLPFEASITICRGRGIVGLMTGHPFGKHPAQPDVVRFLSVMSSRPRSAPAIPVRMPSSGPWLLRILATDRRFIFGVYRRHMKVISYLGALDKLFGAPVTTRSWSTITAIARVLGHSDT